MVFLIFYSKRKLSYSVEDLDKFTPIMNKFTSGLKATHVFNSEKLLLKDLKQKNIELNDYAHIVSTILNLMQKCRCVVNWLKEDIDNEDKASAIKNIELVRSNIERMDEMISKVLEYSSIGKKEEKIKRIDFK